MLNHPVIANQVQRSRSPFPSEDMSRSSLSLGQVLLLLLFANPAEAIHIYWNQKRFTPPSQLFSPYMFTDEPLHTSFLTPGTQGKDRENYEWSEGLTVAMDTSVQLASHSNPSQASQGLHFWDYSRKALSGPLALFSLLPTLGGAHTFTALFRLNIQALIASPCVLGAPALQTFLWILRGLTPVLSMSLFWIAKQWSQQYRCVSPEVTEREDHFPLPTDSTMLNENQHVAGHLSCKGTFLSDM